jgi:hypothetical protein
MANCPGRRTLRHTVSEAGRRLGQTVLLPRGLESILRKAAHPVHVLNPKAASERRTVCEALLRKSPPDPGLFVREIRMSMQPTCCQRFTLRLLRVVDESRSGQIVLQLCDECRTYWLVSRQGSSEAVDPEDFEVDAIERLGNNEASELLLASQT